MHGSEANQHSCALLEQTPVWDGRRQNFGADGTGARRWYTLIAMSLSQILPDLLFGAVEDCISRGA